MNESYLRNVLEAALLAAGNPLRARRARAAVRGERAPEQRASCARRSRRSRAEYEGRGIELKETASGFRIQVRRELAAEISRLWPERAARYSRALLETLALIAYRQPITRAEIEAVRGVAVNPNIIRTVIERNWVRVVGHRDVPGHPELLGTTREFLDYFGLKSLDELPPLARAAGHGRRSTCSSPCRRGRRRGAESAAARAAGGGRRRRRGGRRGRRAVRRRRRLARAGRRAAAAATTDGARAARGAPRRRVARAPRRAARGAGAGDPSGCRRCSRARASPRGARPRTGSAPAGSRSTARPRRSGRASVPRDQVRLDGRLVRAQRAGRRRTPFSVTARPGSRCARPRGACAGHARCGRRSSSGCRARAGRRFISVSPMPRVDGGLELVTSDGALAAHPAAPACTRLTSEFGVRVRGELSEAQLAGYAPAVSSTAATQLAVERCEAAGGEGANRWYTLAARGASGKDVRQLFERQGALVSRVLRTRLGPAGASSARSGAVSSASSRQEELRALLGAGGARPTAGLSVEGCARDAAAGRPQQREIRPGEARRQRHASSRSSAG